MLTFDILNIIMENSGGIISTATIILVLQILLTSYQESRFYYNSIKNSDLFLKIFSSIVPAVLITTWCTIVPITFGSFVNGGMDQQYVSQIVTIFYTEAFTQELYMVVVLYILVTLVYLLIYHLKWQQVLYTFGLETVMLFTLLLIVCLFRGQTPSTKNQFTLFYYLVYGYFMVIYKTVLIIISLLGAALFYERSKTNLDNKQDFLSVRDFEILTVKFLNQQQKMTAVTLTLTSAGLMTIVEFSLLMDKNISVNLHNIIIVLFDLPFLIPLFLFILCIDCYLLVLAFFPKLSSGYRTLKKDERFFQYFYQEVVQHCSSLPTDKVLTTKHFIVVKKVFSVNIEIKQQNSIPQPF